MDLKALWPLLKPLVKQALEQLVVPEVQKLEEQIGNEVVKVLVVAVVDALIAVVEKELAA